MKRNLKGGELIGKRYVCMRHKCAKCCLETRMPLSNHNFKRALKLGCKPECFTAKTDEGWRLKNDYG